MKLTKEKYNSQTKRKFIENASSEEIIEKLGNIENLIDKYNLEGNTQLETLVNVERALMLGAAAVKRIERATNNKVYYISANKVMKVKLVGFDNNIKNPDYIIIEKKGNQTVVHYSEIYISKREAKLEKKGLQIYHLDKEHYDKLFKDEQYNNQTYLIEVKKGSDVFKVYTKVLNTYWRLRKNRTFTLKEIKEIFFFDLEKDFKDEREKFKNKLTK